jgi:hypothetical protein
MQETSGRPIRAVLDLSTLTEKLGIESEIVGFGPLSTYIVKFVRFPNV